MKSNKYYIKVKLSVVFLFLCSTCIFSQSNYADPYKACHKKDVLKVWFRNDSKVDVYAPNLSTRMNKDKSQLFEGYRRIKGDTLEIIITTEVDTVISAFRSADTGKIFGQLSYEDKVLRPGRKYHTKVPVEIPAHVRYLKIRDQIVKINRNK